MRKLYLHIGCGKTGSSALQIWLANNREKLSECNILYPFPQSTNLNDYEITSGNGLAFLPCIKNQTADAVLGELLQHTKNDILYSSEIFQTLDENQLIYLKTLASQHALEVHIIAFVRDVYDMAYSTYIQHLKRHGYDRTFQEFALTQERLMQFSVVENYSRHFEHIHLLHYDSEKKHGLEIALCRALGIDPEVLPAMPKKKVNRSLTYFESQLLLLINQTYKKSFGVALSDSFSTIISDSIIQENPELDTEIYYEQSVYDHFNNKMGVLIAQFNTKYFHGTGLSIFDPEGKHIIQDPAPVSDELRALVQALFKGFLFKLNKSQQIVQFTNKMIETLRDTALSIENTAVNQAYILMRAAQYFRKGPLINQKVLEYGKRMNAARVAPPPAPAPEKK